MRFQDERERDLFEENQPLDKKIRKKTKFLLPRLKNSITLSYENIIFLMIGFVMSCVIFFSLGVEKGRQDMSHRKSVRFSEGAKADMPKVGDSHSQEADYISGQYIIQLASFKKTESAEQELNRLREDGYKGTLRKSGKYYQLYIGGFDTVKSAHILMERLKRRYKDCFVKKLQN